MKLPIKVLIRIFFHSVLPVAIIIGLSTLWVENYLKPQIESRVLKEQALPAITILNNQTTKFSVTGYSIGQPYSTITKSGNPLVNTGFVTVGGIQIFTVAVDPKVIPLGSLIYIEGLGLGMATDTGRAIKGIKIDVCFASSSDAVTFGIQDRNITVLERGK